MSGFLNVIKKNLGLGGSKKATESTESAATAKPKRKGSAYFLELDDAKGTANATAASAKAEAAKVAESVKAEVAKTAESAKAEVAKVVGEPSTNGKQPAAKKKAEAKAKPEAKAAAPAPVAAKPATPVVKQATTFAPEYLMSPNSYSGRRRPGANMNYFLNLAKQAKTPNK